MTSIGIDLGTTNSLVALYDPAATSAIVIPVSGARATPSVVAVRQKEDKDELLVGRPALNWAKADPQNTIVSVKRLMGRDLADDVVAQTIDRRAYEIVHGSDDDPRAHVVMAGTRFTPAAISGMILQRLRHGAEDRLKQDITHAVITVPAYFSTAQRTATREAGEQAGLTVKRIIDEPTAAAIAFGVELREGDRRRVLVFDLGGGTFDISVLNATRDAEGHNHFQVLDFVGDNWLGGDDFDDLIVEKINAYVRDRTGLDPSGSAEYRFHAKRAAEEAKRELSEADSADIVIPAAFRASGSTYDVEMTLERGEFDEMIAPLVDKTLSLVRSALERQGLSPDDISDVLLVGGSTLIPKVYSAVENYFGKAKVRKHVDPMECVAIGAGILAGTLSGFECAACGTVNDDSRDTCVNAQCGADLSTARSIGDTHVYDVTGMALGVRAVRGSQSDAFVPIIPRGTPYPTSEPIRHTFEATDGRVIRVPVFEGDDPMASRNHEQGVIEYELPEKIDIHTRVTVSFHFDMNRVLHVTIGVPGTSLEYRKELRFDVARSGKPAPAVKEEEEVTHREDLIYAEETTRRFLRTYEQFLDATQTMKINADLERAQNALVFSDPAECRRMISVLESDIFATGLASQLYLAERAAERASPADAEQINQAIARLQKEYLGGRRDAAVDEAQVLKVMTAKIWQQHQVGAIEDAEDFNGLLRIVEGS
ncbi:Hsp70 family protein [Actinomycetospora chibensis]|uniref:Hsp70 family protein n=1 Tax=Actinomycetospora chibensis TaxID=663606 RepID=A0ABV9RHM4_9PSEU|nr:Hsp70 family protein [Actinomycetospora chibensis]MDD7927615.1 Hsp70 family protein [Actinomycetospora chibensis]